MGSYYRHLNDIQRQLMAFDVKNVGKVMALIENISDDEDVVKVVRCKGCRWYAKGVCRESHWFNSEWDIEVEEDDYCSYGERRVENDS